VTPNLDELSSLQIDFSVIAPQLITASSAEHLSPSQRQVTAKFSIGNVTPNLDELSSLQIDFSVIAPQYDW